VTLCPKVWWTEILNCLTLKTKTLRPLATVTLNIIRRFVLKWISNVFLKTAYLSTYGPNTDAFQILDRIPVGGGGGGEIFRTRPDRSSGLFSQLYNGYRVLPAVKRPGCGVDRPPHLAPRLNKEYSYTSTPPMGLRGLF